MLSYAYATPKPRATATASPYARSLHVVVQRAVNQFPLECFYAKPRVYKAMHRACFFGKTDIVFPRYRDTPSVRSSKCRTEKQSWDFGLGELKACLQVEASPWAEMPAPRTSSGAIQMAWSNEPIT